MNKMEHGELISAVVDGQVQQDALERGLESIESDAQLQSAWETYHLVGDVLRSPDLANGGSSMAFLERLRPALAQEVVKPALSLVEPATSMLAGRDRPAANDVGYRWKLVAGVASVAAVLAVGWNVAAVGTGGFSQLAAAPTSSVAGLAGGERNVMVRDPRLDELLAAHRQFGSATAIQMPSGALRNAAFEAPAR